MSVTTENIRPRLSHFRQAMLSLYWFGSSLHWTALFIITLPKQAQIIGGDALKGQTQGAVFYVIPIVSMLVAPLFGALSDRIHLPLGRRRPWILVGTIMNIIGLFGLTYFPRANDMSSLLPYVLAFTWVVFWNNVATAPYSALIPDIVPQAQRGSAAGWYGLMNMLGTAGGFASGLIFTQGDVTNLEAIYFFVGVALLIGMLGTVIFTKEYPYAGHLPPFRWGEFFRGLIDPLRDHDFRWVFWTRFLMVGGTYTVQQFLQYYMDDVIKPGNFVLFGSKVATTAESAVSFFGLTLILGALVSALAAGILSDRFGRKMMVYISSVLQALVPILFIFFTDFTFAVMMGIVFGLGYGAYQAVDWALASDVLPSDTDYAKDMGVWHVAFTLPQTLAVPLAGYLRDTLQVVGQRPTVNLPNLGYQAIFALAVVYFVLGTVLVSRIRKVR